MSTQHIIGKAVAAAGDNWVMVFDWEHDKLYAQVHAALEAVAADIWAQGFESGVGSEQSGGHFPNPYERERP